MLESILIKCNEIHENSPIPQDNDSASMNFIQEYTSTETEGNNKHADI